MFKFGFILTLKNLDESSVLLLFYLVFDLVRRELSSSLYTVLIFIRYSFRMHGKCLEKLLSFRVVSPRHWWFWCFFIHLKIFRTHILLLRWKMKESVYSIILVCWLRERKQINWLIRELSERVLKNQNHSKMWDSICKAMHFISRNMNICEDMYLLIPFIC